jgi:quinol monooxygenase YgiN
MLRRFVFFGPVTMSALCLAGGVAGGAEAPQETTRVLTFIEVRHDAIDRGTAILRQYKTALHPDGASLRVEILEEIARPERFAILESATRIDALTGAEERAQDILTSLNGLLIAPPDRRTNREFANPATATPGKVSEFLKSPSALYVVAHLDIGPPDQAKGVAALARLIDAARHSEGNILFEAWQQSNRPNHFNLISSWSTRAQLNEFTDGAPAREFRASVAPLIGSPYDERIYQRL